MPHSILRGHSKLKAAGQKDIQLFKGSLGIGTVRTGDISVIADKASLFFGNGYTTSYLAYFIAINNELQFFCDISRDAPWLNMWEIRSPIGGLNSID
jgi:hypothetical protein